MGRFLNPDNSVFQDVINTKIYVDKTELLDYTNSVINTTEKFICCSRPRRFGKSVTAYMLAAYYSKGCESEQLFSGFRISEMGSFKKHLNSYDVIRFDTQWCMVSAGRPENAVSFITEEVIRELKVNYPDLSLDKAKSLPDALSCVNTATGTRFIVIIDEWDAMIRDEACSVAAQEDYINFLRGMFKGIEPARFISLAYLTGILPIKKLRTQSSLNNFEEFTMLDAGELVSYTGFTETEVRSLCREYHKDFNEVKRWYDGYLLGGQHIYNPKAVVSVMNRGTFKSYWS